MSPTRRRDGSRRGSRTSGARGDARTGRAPTPPAGRSRRRRLCPRARRHRRCASADRGARRRGRPRRPTATAARSSGRRRSSARSPTPAPRGMTRASCRRPGWRRAGSQRLTPARARRDACCHSRAWTFTPSDLPCAGCTSGTAPGRWPGGSRLRPGAGRGGRRAIHAAARHRNSRSVRARRERARRACAMRIGGPPSPPVWQHAPP